jgi:dTDP-4-amino-4,6-dideoxygalactose transaminase
MNFNIVTEFEQKVSDFFGAPYGVATDSCTHAIELCLRYTNAKQIFIPKHTYIGIPLLAKKLNIDLLWNEISWEKYYFLTTDIIDAAVFWEKNGYIPNTFMCLSFQYQKHLNIGRGGMILCNNQKTYGILSKMSYDGRKRDIPWREQNIDTIGYHYYMTPEAAQIGLNKLNNAINTIPKKWNINDWPDVSKMKVFNE